MWNRLRWGAAPYSLLSREHAPRIRRPTRSRRPPHTVSPYPAVRLLASLCENRTCLLNLDLLKCEKLVSRAAGLKHGLSNHTFCSWDSKLRQYGRSNVGEGRGLSCHFPVGE